MNAVVFEHVSKRFEGRTAVDQLDLYVPEASIFGLLGPNGAGKTTSIRMMMTILAPDDGQIRILGEAPSPRLKDRIGYLPEERGLYRSMRVIDNLVFFARIHGLPHETATRRAHDWLERFRMTALAGKRLQELSKGNQQRIQFIATVMHEPQLLVLDEPFSGLDPVNQEEMRAAIVTLAKNGTTIVLSTHGMDEVERLCTHITLVHEGRALLAGSLDEVRATHGGSVVRLDFRGDPECVSRHPSVNGVTRSGATLEARLQEGADPGRFLADIAPQLSVHHFEVRTASLHSIFVEKVRGTA